MPENYNDEEEISLIDLLAVLYKYRKLIGIITGAAALIVVLFSIISVKLPADISPLPNTYKAECSAFVNDSSDFVKTNVKNSALAVYYATSNPVIDATVQQFDLINKWKITEKAVQTSREILKKNLNVEFDKDLNLLKISYSSTDPKLAYDIVNFIFGKDQELLKNNEQQLLQQQLLQQQLLQQQYIQNQSESQLDIIQTKINSLPEGAEKDNSELEYSTVQQIYLKSKADSENISAKIQAQQDVLSISEPAEIPEKKIGPSRSKICIIVVFAAFFVSILIAFLLNAIKNIKADPEAMQKFKD